MTKEKYELRFKERFWSKVNKTENGCWLWAGGKDPEKYGVFWDERIKQNRRAHRVALMLEGQDVTDKLVLHSCDNPSCVNPNHLRVGTILENIQDKVDRKRSSGWKCKYRNKINPRIKYTTKDLAEIKDFLAKGGDIKEIALKFKVSVNAIKCVLRRKCLVSEIPIVDSNFTVKQ